MGGCHPGAAWSVLIATLALAFGCTASEGDRGACSGAGEANAALSRRCFPKRLEVELDPSSADFGRTTCEVYEVFIEGSAACSCNSPGYSVPARVPQPVVDELSRTGTCAEGDPCCSNRCFCELQQLRGAELAACQNGTENALEPPPIGWCYVDPEQGVGTAEVVDSCPVDQKRLLRYLVPHSSIHAVVICKNVVM